MGFKDFEHSWRLVDRIVGVRAQFEACRRDGVRAQFEACRRDCMISSPVRGLESGLHEFKPSSMFGVGIGGVRAQFEACRWDCKISITVRGL